MQVESGSVGFESVSVSFGGVNALRKATATVPARQLTALVGPNGAGKTTLINVISGFIRPDEGSIHVGPNDITRLPPHKISQLGVARTFQDLRLFAQMTVLDNVLLAYPSQTGESFTRLFLNWSHVNRQEQDFTARALGLLEFVELSHKAKVLASELSYGQQKRLALARVLATGSETLLLDEPAAGLDPHGVQRMGTLLQSLVNAGKTVCLIEHNLELVADKADWVIGMAQGEVVVMGPPAEALSDATLVNAYMSGGSLGAPS